MIYSALKNIISNTGWQQEPMTQCLTYSKEFRRAVYQTDQSVCDGGGIAVCKKRIGKTIILKIITIILTI